MKKTVIKFSLDSTDIERAIQELNTFAQNFREKVDAYRKRLSEEIAGRASLNFGSSVVDDVIKGGSPRMADVNVSVSHKGKVSVVVANGEDAVWCEFGAGVYHNGSVGSSPNPLGSQLGFTIGSYGKGYGKGQAWGFYGDSGELIITRGTKATMPMYNAAQEVLRISVEIAREVFGQ